MGKFEFENSNYAMLWNDRNVLSSYLEVTPYLNMNFGFWRSQFTVDPITTPSDDKGNAAFTMDTITRQPAPMADMRAPLGRGKSIDLEGLHRYTASIPHFIAPTIHEQAFERMAKESMFEQTGNDAAIMKQWTLNLQALLDSANQSLSYMAAQVLSTGKINYQGGRAMKGMVYDALIPKENIVKAGTNSSDKAWTDVDCPILDQMAAIEFKFRKDNGFENIPMIWQIPYDMFYNVFLKNKQVRQFVTDYRTNNDLATTAGYIITEEVFKEVMKLYPQISPIEIVSEKQRDYTGIVSGWKDGIAVLRPSGYAGVIKHTSNFDSRLLSRYGSSVVTSVFSTIEDIFTVANTTLNNGSFREWHTELYMDAVPALDEVPYHLIVNTKQAGSGLATLS